MSSIKETIQSIYKITSKLITIGASVEQNFPTEKKVQGLSIISWGESNNLSVALKNISYDQIYDALQQENNYNIKLLDGALLQLMYTFEMNKLISHRLAFFPSPYLEVYQNDPEIYEHDELYADIISKSITPFPIRFDFNCSDELHIEFDHAKSHMTLGQYKNCRIPVSSPIGPNLFIDFILRNFYSGIYKRYSSEEAILVNQFENTITTNERKLLHFNFGN